MDSHSSIGFRPGGGGGRGNGHRIVYHYLLYPVIIIVTLILVTVINGRVLREAVYDTHRHDLETITRIVRNAVPPEALSNVTVADEFVGAVSASTAVRVTLIAPDGRVLGDSHADQETMENHAGRPEIREALRGKEGVSIRRSSTINKDLIYVALPITGSGLGDTAGRAGSNVIGVIRGALVVEGVEARLTTLLRRLVIPGVALLVMALLAAYFGSRSIRLPLKELHGAAVAYRQGELDRPVLVTGPVELTDLARTFESMAKELQRRLRQLDAQRRETEEVLNTIKEPLLLIDEYTRIQRVNDAAARFLGVPPDVAQGRLLLDLFRNSTMDTFVRRVIQRRTVEEAHIIVAGRRERHLLAWGVHLTSEGSLLRGNTLLLLRDVTPEYRLQQIRKDFVANVSHELKTPLTMIQGAVETLADIPPEESEERERFQGMIANHTHRMSKIIEDLLNLARIEQTEEEIVKEEVTISHLVHECVDTIRERGGDGCTVVETVEPADLTWSVQPALFGLAVSNLVDNARRYSPRGGTITVHAQEEGGSLVLSVSDQGIGIPDNEQDRVFERFYRVDQGRSRTDGGTGLGLAIVKHVSRIHGGRVTVRSEVGRGSTFTMVIPRATPKGEFS